MMPTKFQFLLKGPLLGNVSCFLIVAKLLDEGTPQGDGVLLVEMERTEEIWGSNSG